MTRVLLDTNVIISALLYPGSTPDLVMRLVLDDHHLVLCEQIVSELHVVVRRKRPDLIASLKDLWNDLDAEMAPVGSAEVTMADPADEPILAGFGLCWRRRAGERRQTLPGPGP